jgi:hypothetical protein
VCCVIHAELAPFCFGTASLEALFTPWPPFVPTSGITLLPESFLAVILGAMDPDICSPPNPILAEQMVTQMREVRSGYAILQNKAAIIADVHHHGLFSRASHHPVRADSALLR